jgi:2-(1,2-epoxy-1,2-dihydrophenyl)acetyl-CoA isomerase
MLTNRRLSAEEALDWGIATRVVEDAELEAESLRLAGQIAAGPTGSYGAVKRLLALSFESSLEAQLEHESQAISEAALTADGREGVAAFFAKRAPQFTGN